ncbi:unnamed protein product, partial [Musa banksii]
MEAYVRNGGVGMARLVFDEMCMRDVGLQPSPVTLAVLLRACCAAEDVAGGCQLHGFVIKMGFGGHELVQNSILTMFSKLSCLEVAQKLFDDIQNRSVASWNILVSMYSSMGDVSGAIDSYEKMKMELSPSSETLTSLLSALANTLWCIMMWGFLQNGEFLETVHLFRRMQEAGFMPGKDALRVLVMACSHLGVLMWGKGIHGYL